MNLSYWLHHPDRILSRVRYFVWERMNMDKPWLCPSSVRFCDLNLTATMIGLEFGSGRSTVWFGQRLGRLVSVEHHSGWHARVRDRLESQNLINVDYRLIPLDHPELEPERAEYARVPSYVAVTDVFPDESLDLVVVDGHYRTHCIRRCLGKLRPAGLLLVDDTNLWPTREKIPVPADWPVADLGSNGIKQTCIWRKPS
jgi:Methyltransferase domain